MSIARRKAGAVALAIAALALPLTLGQAQERVQLVPQLGMGSVTAVAFSRDGRFVLAGSGDNTARLWDVESGLLIRSFVGDTDIIVSVAFSPDGRFVLTGSNDGTARLWNAETGRLAQSFKGKIALFSADGRRVLTGSGTGDDAARLWDANTGQLIQTFWCSQGDPVSLLALAPDGQSLLGVCGAGALTIWDVKTGRQKQAAKALGNSPEEAIVFSAEGPRVLSVGWDHIIKLWNAQTGELIRSFAGPKELVRSVAFSPDGQRALTGSDDNTAKLWNVETGQLIRTFEGHEDPIRSVGFSRDGRNVLTGSDDDTARLWNAETGQLIRTFKGHTAGVNSAAFSPNGRQVLIGNWNDAGMLWDAETGQPTRTFEAQPDQVRSVVFSSDGRTVLTGSEGVTDNAAKFWDAETGRLIRSLGGHGEFIRDVALSPDGRRVLTGNDDGTAKLWDAETGELIRSLGKQGDWKVECVAFSADGRWVLTGSENSTTRLWDAETGALVQTFVEPGLLEVASVSFSPDGRQVLTGTTANGSAAARLWDAKTGQLLRTFKGHTDGVSSAVFSPDGREILTGSFDHTAKLWDAGTGQEIHTFEGHTDAVVSATFSPDGRFVLTASADTTTRIWDTASGKQLAVLLNFANGGWAVVDPEGRFDSNDLDGGAPLVWVASSEPMRPLPLEIFMRDYYTPRLLTSILNGETLPAIRPISEIRNRVQPEVEILSVTASKTQPGRADVVVHAAGRTEPGHDGNGAPLRDARGSAAMQASGLADLRLFRNGQLVGIRPGALAAGDFTFTGIQLPALSQSVRFTAYAFNSERIKSATAAMDYAYNSAPAAKRRAFLLQIGVNHYEASNCELNGSVNDAEKLSKILSDRLAARGLDVSAVMLISTEEINDATKAKIRSALAAIAAAATPDDVFFLSFSGHGYTNPQGEFYILPSDMQGTCAGLNDRMLSSTISADELAAWFEPIDVGQMTFILDSCDSAGSVESNGFKPGPMGSRGLGQLAYDKRMRILAASQPNQAARESGSLGQGLLSYTLTEEGLLERKADWKPVDGKIMVGEWLGYAANAVPEILESGAVKTARGVYAIGQPEHDVKSAQTPAVFDFSKSDSFVLQ